MTQHAIQSIRQALDAESGSPLTISVSRRHAEQILAVVQALEDDLSEWKSLCADESSRAAAATNAKNVLLDEIAYLQNDPKRLEQIPEQGEISAIGWINGGDVEAMRKHGRGCIVWATPTNTSDRVVYVKSEHVKPCD